MSAARPLLHGDELALGSSKLVCHIHPGTETCDGCEPGQVQAQMQAQAKEEEACVQLLSKGDKEKLRKQHLAMIRKKYGLKVITVKPVLRDHQRTTKIWSVKTGGLLIEGHLNYNVRPGIMKMWSLNRSSLLIKVVAQADLTEL